MLLSLFFALVIGVGLQTVPSRAIAEVPMPTPTPFPTPAPTPAQVRVPGQPIRWEIFDGREATLMLSKNEPTKFKFDVEYADSSCPRGIVKQPTCHFLTPMEIDQFIVVWTKHPDAKKIGKPVQYKFGGGGDFMDVKEEFFATNYHAKIDPQQFSKMGQFEIVCDDYSWVSGHEQAPERLNITTWATEFMLQNRETGTTENTTLGNIFDLALVRTEAGSLALTETGIWSSMATSLLPLSLFYGDIANLVETLPTGEICQTSLKMSTGNVEKKLLDYIDHVPKNYKVYVDGQDKLFDHRSKGFSLLESAFSTQNPGDLQ